MYAMTGEQRWAHRVIEALRVVASPGSAVGSVSEATLDGSIADAYDILSPLMNDADRSLVRAYLRRGIDLYRQHILTRPVQWGIGTNIFLHEFYNYVGAIAAAYQHDTDEQLLREAVGLARRALHAGVDEGGCIGEGPSYGVTDAWTLTFAAEVFQRAGVADFWHEEPRFVNLMRHWTHLMMPGKRGQESMSDSWRAHAGRPFWPALVFARRLNDPTALWVWEGMQGRSPNGTLGPAPECFYFFPGYVALYEDDDTPPQRPSGSAWPTARNSGRFGSINMRSGWGDDDISFTLLAAGRSPGCIIHQHFDAGHFSLCALNEVFSIDTGYGDIQGRYHSLVMPEGEEATGWTRQFANVFPGGRVEAFAHGKAADYARVDVHEQWQCRWALRHAMLVRSPVGDGVEPYIVIFDDYNKASDYARYLWLLNTEPGNRVVLDHAAKRASIHGKVNRLDLAWSVPDPGDYPIRHTIELETDEIDSFALPHRPNDVSYFTGDSGQERKEGNARWGAGVRPRLKVWLGGQNGLMLSALMPRRAGTPPLPVKMVQTRGQFGMTIDHGSVTDTILVAPIHRSLHTAGVDAEATMVVARRDKAGKLIWWCAADTYAATIDGHDVLHRRPEAVALAEM